MAPFLESAAGHLAGIARETWNLWLDMGVYLVFGFAVAGILSRVLKREFIARHLGGNTLGAVAKASLFGVPLPLCSCGVIPVALSLYRRGASRGATVSFLISTPETGVDSILVTYSLLGPVFAVVRPIAAFLNGLLGGGLVALFARNKKSNGESQTALSSDFCSSGTCSAMPGEPSSADPTDGWPQVTEPRVSLARHLVEAFRYGFLEFPREIVMWLVIGIVAAGVLAHLMPHNFLEQHLGTGFQAMLAMAIVGIPLYICATASVPFVAVLVVHGGLSAGAALVFLITGPATNVASLILIARTLGRRTAAIYLASILFTSFAGGYLLDAGFAATGTTLSAVAAHPHGQMLPSWLRIAGAAGLAAIVIVGLARNRRARIQKRKEAAEMTKREKPALELTVTGMTCENCVRHVSAAAQAVAGVTAARVDLKRGLVQVFGDAPDRAALIQAIESAGYKAQ